MDLNTRHIQSRLKRNKSKSKLLLSKSSKLCKLAPLLVHNTQLKENNVPVFTMESNLYQCEINKSLIKIWQQIR